MKSSPRIATLILLAMLVACQREPAPAPAPASPVDAPTTKASATPASRQGNAFTVEVTLSPAARERLTKQGESVIVGAEYFGYPTAQAQAQHVPGSENPWLTLHRAQVELAGRQLDGTPTATFSAVMLDSKQLAWTDAPDAPQVNINVYSGRRSSPDNMLECEMFQDTLASAARTPIRLSCGLIGGSAR